MTTGNTYV
jgi:hypothetical protein